jgi:hypothetical protein
MEHRLMTDREIADIFAQARQLRAEGKVEEAKALHRTTPIPPFLAKVLKEKVGAYILIKGGWNLAEAEAEFGPGWLDS